MIDSWRLEMDDPPVAEDDASVCDEIDTYYDPEVGTGESDEAEHAAWLRGLPDDIRADYLALPWAGPPETDPAGYWHHDVEPASTGPGSAAIGFAAGGALDTLSPGPDLAGFVAATDAQRTELDESALIGVLCAWQRLAAWAQAGQAATVMTLAHRREAQALELDRPSLAEHVSDEVATALRLTGRSANRLLAIAGGLDRLPDVHAALNRGEIDWAKACIFTDLLTGLPDDAARAIAADLLGSAGRMTSGQLRAALTLAVLAYDPEATERRREEARADSSVSAWTETSGNAALAGRELATNDVVHANARLSALARWLRKNGASEPMDQLRAAVYIALLTGRTVESLLPREPDATDIPDAATTDSAAPADSASTSAPPPDTATRADWPRLTGSINLTMPMSTWLGWSNSPGEVASYGPVDAVAGRQLANAMAGDSHWCLTLTDPAGRAVAHACAREGPRRSADRCTGIRWAVDLGKRLQLLETAPCGHTRQSGSYKPPGSLRHLIVIRQRTCSFPGCRRPARRCDLDHTIPFDHGGRTCECNLAPLCRRHHQAKQAPGWHLEQREPGRMTWRLPSGRIYETTGDPY